MNGAIRALEAIKNEGVKGGEGEGARLAVTVPWVDPPRAPPGRTPVFEAGGSEEEPPHPKRSLIRDASAAESMFGKRSKKKKAKMPKAGGGVVAGASALASALRSGPSLERRSRLAAAGRADV